MSTEEQLVVFLLLNSLLYVAILAYIARRKSRSADGSEGSATPTPAADATRGRGAPDSDSDTSSTVDCPSCGAINDAAYKFCRSCVSELRGAPAQAIGV